MYSLRNVFLDFGRLGDENMNLYHFILIVKIYSCHYTEKKNVMLRNGKKGEPRGHQSCRSRTSLRKTQTRMTVEVRVQRLLVSYAMFAIVSPKLKMNLCSSLLHRVYSDDNECCIRVLEWVEVHTIVHMMLVSRPATTVN